MSSLLLILLSAALASVVVLQTAPRWRPFVGIVDVFAGARAMALTALLIVPATTALSWTLAAYVLQPLALGALRTVAFAAVLLIAVSLAEAALRRRAGPVPQQPGFALLSTANGAALGTALAAQSAVRSLLDAVFFSLGAAIAFGVLLLALAAMLERLRAADAPRIFRDAPLALFTAGLMALGFMGFSGLVRE